MTHNAAYMRDAFTSNQARKGHQTAERQVLISPIHHHRYLQYISRDSLFCWHTFVAPCAIERFPPLHRVSWEIRTDDDVPPQGSYCCVLVLLGTCRTLSLRYAQ